MLYRTSIVDKCWSIGRFYPQVRRSPTVIGYWIPYERVTSLNNVDNSRSLTGTPKKTFGCPTRLKQEPKAAVQALWLCKMATATARVIILDDVLFAPGMKPNLLSAKRLVQKCFKVTLDEAGAIIHRNGVVGATAELSGNLLVFRQLDGKADLVTSHLVRIVYTFEHRILGYSEGLQDAKSGERNWAQKLQVLGFFRSLLQSKMQKKSISKTICEEVEGRARVGTYGYL